MELLIGWLLGMASLCGLLWYTSVRASNLHTGQDDHKYNFEPPTAPHVIDVGAGSLLPRTNGSLDIASTRRGLEAVRRTAASKSYWEKPSTPFARELDKALAPKRNDWAVTSTGEVASLDDVPKDCICDWEGDYIMCQENPVSYVLGRIDEACPVHGDPEADYWTHRRDL